METKPRFKNSFAVKGTKGEREHFKELVEKMGWERQGCRQDNVSYLIFKSSDPKPAYLKPGNYCESSDLTSSSFISAIELSTPEGWQRALFLAEEKEEEVQEYIMSKCREAFPFGKIYKCIGFKYPLYFIKAEDNKEYTIHLDFVEISTKEAYDRQELLEEAKRRLPYKACFQTEDTEVNISSGDLYWSDGALWCKCIAEKTWLSRYNKCVWNGKFIFEVLNESSPTKEEIERVLNHLQNEQRNKI